MNRTVMSDAGPDAAGDATLRFDDEAASPLPAISQRAGGTYRPTTVGPGDFFAFPAPTPSGLAELSGFYGSDPNGPWSLWVMDDTAVGAGRLAGRSGLTIEARVRKSGSPQRAGTLRSPDPTLLLVHRTS